MILGEAGQGLSSKKFSYLNLVDTGEPEHNWEKYYKLKPGDVFVEAGAFWGRYGKVASPKVGASGKVVLIEGSPDNQQTIEDLINRDNLSNVTLVRAAVANQCCRAYYLSDGNPAGHRLAKDVDFELYQKNRIVPVEVVTLDKRLPQHVDHVDLLACDIEGAEVSLVKGAKTLLSQNKIFNVALAAYHAAANAKQIIEILRGVGFKDLVYEDGIVYGHI
jgi:FkbM family methyltransferase